MQQWLNINLNPERHLSCPVSRQPPLILRSLSIPSIYFSPFPFSSYSSSLCCLFSLSFVFRSTTTTTVTVRYFISSPLASRLVCTEGQWKQYFSPYNPIRYASRFVSLVKSSSFLIRDYLLYTSSKLDAFYYSFPRPSRVTFNRVPPIVLTSPFSRTMFSRSFFHSLPFLFVFIVRLECVLLALFFSFLHSIHADVAPFPRHSSFRRSLFHFLASLFHFLLGE